MVDSFASLGVGQDHGDSILAAVIGVVVDVGTPDDMESAWLMPVVVTLGCQRNCCLLLDDNDDEEDEDEVVEDRAGAGAGEELVLVFGSLPEQLTFVSKQTTQANDASTSKYARLNLRLIVDIIIGYIALN